MSENVFCAVESSVLEYASALQKNGETDRINITYGIGDHFRMSEDYLKKVILSGQKIIESSNLADGFSSIFISTSLIDPLHIIRSRIDIMSSMSGLVHVIPLVVFDPLKVSCTPVLTSSPP